MPKSGDDMVVEGRYGKLLLAKIIGYSSLRYLSAERSAKDRFYTSPACDREPL